MYYAEFHVYGLGKESGGDRLARFETKEERDEWVERMETRSLYGELYWEPVTTRSISYKYDLRKFDDDPYDDYREEISVERTCLNKAVMVIGVRPSFHLQ